MDDNDINERELFLYGCFELLYSFVVNKNFAVESLNLECHIVKPSVELVNVGLRSNNFFEPPRTVC